MNINLENLSACEKGIRWFKDFKNPDHEAVIKQLMVEDRFEWANWLIPRLLDKDRCILYALKAISLIDSEIFKAVKKEIETSKDLKYSAWRISWIPGYGGPVSCCLYCVLEPDLRYCAPWATHTGTSVASRDEYFKVPIINYGLELLNDHAC